MTMSCAGYILLWVKGPLSRARVSTTLDQEAEAHRIPLELLSVLVRYHCDAASTTEGNFGAAVFDIYEVAAADT